jgi:hypothetical protein
VKGCCPFLPVWTDALLKAAAHCSAKQILKKDYAYPTAEYGTGIYLSNIILIDLRTLRINVKIELLHAFPNPVFFGSILKFSGKKVRI